MKIKKVSYLFLQIILTWLAVVSFESLILSKSADDPSFLSGMVLAVLFFHFLVSIASIFLEKYYLKYISSIFSKLCYSLIIVLGITMFVFWIRSLLNPDGAFLVGMFWPVFLVIFGMVFSFAVFLGKDVGNTFKNESNKIK
mgnify:CR=1 FL=1